MLTWTAWVNRHLKMYYGNVFVIVYKHFDQSLHVGLSDPTCVQNFRPVSLTVFEILGFKLKNENDNNNENWRNGRLLYLPS